MKKRLRIRCILIFVVSIILIISIYMIHLLISYKSFVDSYNTQEVYDNDDKDSKLPKFDSVKEMYSIGDLTAYEVTVDGELYILVETPDGRKLVSVEEYYRADEEESPNE